METLEQGRFEYFIESGDEVAVTNPLSPFFGYDGVAVAPIDTHWLVQFPWGDRSVSDVIEEEHLVVIPKRADNVYSGG